MSTRHRPKIWSAVGGKFGILLIALIALLATTPLAVTKPIWNMLLALFADGVLVAGLYAARPGRKFVTIGVVLASTDLAIGRIVAVYGIRGLIALQMMLWLTILVFVTLTLLETIFESDTVSVEILQASLCIYLLIGLVWVFFYILIEFASPGSFQSTNGSRIDWSSDHSRRTAILQMFVFSYSSLSGAAGGDLSAATGFTRIASCLEAMMGQIYLAVVIARLVGIQSAQTPGNGRPESGTVSEEASRNERDRK